MKITETLYSNDLPIDFIGLPSINKIQLLIGDHGFYFKKYLKNLVYTRNQYILNS